MMALLLPAGATAQERVIDPAGGVTLAGAIEIALEREPALRAARAGVDVARGLRVQAGLRPNPSAGFMQETETSGAERRTRVEAAWPLDLFRRPGRVAAADRAIDSASYAAIDRERLLAGRVRLAYGAVAAAVRQRDVASELAAATARQHGLIATRVEEGANPPVERDLLGVELLRLEADVELLAGAVEERLVALKRLLGMPPDAPLALADSIEALAMRETGPPPAVAAAAVDARPDVREAASRVALAEARVDLARRQGRVDASITGAYMRMAPESRGPLHFFSAGVMVMLPLRDRNQGAVAAARAELIAAQAEADAARLEAEAEIAGARARDERARRAMQTYARARPLAAENLEVVRQTYELGRATVFDVLAEQRRYLDTERAYTAALREAYDARQSLRVALGEIR